MTRGVQRSVGALAIAILAAGWAEGAGDGSAAVADLEHQWAQAQVKGDVAALGRIYADDVVYVHSSGTVDTKAQLLEKVKGGALRYQKVELVDPRVRVYGDAAVVNGAFDVVAQADGEAVNRRVLYVHVYVRQGGTWRMVAHQTTKAPGQP